MRRVIISAAALLAAVAIAAFTRLEAKPSNTAPRFTPDQKLEFPADYREWIFLSSGPAVNPTGPRPLGNTFVQPNAYRQFVKTGKWPDGSIFVLEGRNTASEGPDIFRAPVSFQSDLVSVEAKVKDTKRFQDTAGWGYFKFGKDRDPAMLRPGTETCYTCHSQNGAVDQTFVQFYPTMIDIAKAHGTFKK